MADPSRLNPFTDRGPWGVVEIGGLRLPGIVLSIDGADRPEVWEVQKATAKSGAATVWKGTGLSETLKIVLALANADAFDAYYDVQLALRPTIGSKPPSHIIVSPVINFNGITRVSCKNVGQPRWVASGGYWTGEIELLQYEPPKPANTGQAAKPKPGDYSNPGRDPNADVKKQIDDIMKDIAKGAAA